MKPLLLGAAATSICLALATPMIPSVARAQPMMGDWDVYCCNRGYHFTLKVTQQDGATFSGIMIYLVDGMRDTVSGRMDGDRVEFDRRGAWGQQHWSGRLVGEGGQQKIVDGRWTGFGTNLTSSLEFTATRLAGATAAPAPVAIPPAVGAPIPEGQSLLGAWNLHCCNNSYLWRMDIVSDDGVSFKGSLLNLNTNQPDGDIAGRRSPGGRVDFERTGPWGAQHWSAELGGSGLQQQMSNGRWAGTGSDMGASADFHAERPGALAATAAARPAPVPARAVPSSAAPSSAPPAMSPPSAPAAVRRTTVTGPAVILYDVWNSEACALTSTSLLSIRRSARLSRVETWYNWRAGEASVPYTLVSFTPDGPLGGQIIARGVLVRGDCDPIQSSWCVATGPVAADLEPGQYVLHTASARVCYNHASGGPQSGFIKAYGSPL